MREFIWQQNKEILFFLRKQQGNCSGTFTSAGNEFKCFQFTHVPTTEHLIPHTKLCLSSCEWEGEPAEYMESLQTNVCCQKAYSGHCRIRNY
jgi:hypothetical protein